MRLQVIFETNRLPVSYHYLFVSVIKQSVSCSNDKMIQELYTYEGKGNKKSKNFTFSIFLEGYQKEQDEFLIDGHVKWNISSSDSEFMLYLYNGLMEKRHFQYKGYELCVREVNLMPERMPKKEKVLCKTMSPIHIKNQRGKTLAPVDEGFHEAFQYICNQTIQNAVGRSLQSEILFKPLSMKKVIVKQKHDAFKQLNNESILYVEAYQGTFELEGNVQDLQVLYQIGLGMRRSQGFGNIEIIQG